MLRIFKSPEVQDKTKDNAGCLQVGLQISNNYKPLAFQVNGNNSAITSFKVISVDINNNELEQIVLPTSIIKIDSSNNLYYVDSRTSYSNTLCDGYYYFEFSNNRYTYKSEYFEVKQETENLTFDNSYITFDSNIITFDQTKITIE